MKQVNYVILYQEGIEVAGKWQQFEQALDEIQSRPEYETASDILLKLNFAGIQADTAQLILQYIHERLPKVKTAGLSLILAGKRANLYMMAMNVQYFEHSTVEILEVPGCIPKEQYGLARNLMGDFLDKGKNLRGVEILAAGLYTDIGSSVQDVAMAHGGVPIFGAVAGFHDAFDHETMKDMKGRPVPQFICGRDVHEGGGLVIKFLGETLHVHLDYTVGWKPVGKELRVTDAENNYCIRKIDGEPAAEVYQKYLGVDASSDAFIDNIFAFPLVAERKGVMLARVPVHHDADGTLHFYGAIQPDDKLRLAYGNPLDLLRESYEAAKRLEDFGPEAVSVIACGIRDAFLKNDADEEIGNFMRIQDNLEIFCGTGEVYLKDGCGGMMNSTLVAVGMRECDEPVHIGRPIGDRASDGARKDVIPLSTRLARFLEVTTSELNEMAEQAKAANIAKSQFLSNMSHEIRTPINAVLGMDEMILRESREPAILEYANNIRSAGNSLLGIVNDILDFSKIEAGKMDIIPVEYALSSMLNDIMTMMQQRAEAKGLTLDIEADPSLPSVLNGDEIRIKQMLLNLLSNAVKYTKQGGVTLSVKACPAAAANRVEIEFHVIDTGIGIREDEREKLFRAFERIDETRNRNIEGTGLGMSITRSLLALMGAHLKVDSEYGRGSDFSFVLSQPVVNPEPMGNFADAYHHSTEPHTSYEEAFTAPKAKLLVVDDTVMNLTVVKSLLKQTKMDIELVQSGFDCLEATEQKKYDIILLDHRMPRMDGIETLKALKASETNLNHDTPVISLTANAVSGAREEYIRAGFDDYLTKPVNSTQLEKMLLKYLPKEKVKLQERARTERTPDVLPQWLLDTDTIQTAAGLKNCGTPENYLDTLKVFHESVSSGIWEIQSYFDAEDWKDYTTKVHALKSTALIIGAVELSERAKRLENAGNNGYIDEIRRDTPALLALYQSFEESLSPLADEEACEEDKPAITEAELADAWETMREFAGSFDDENLSFILDSMKAYLLPEEAEKTCRELTEALRRLDWDKIQALLQN